MVSLYTDQKHSGCKFHVDLRYLDSIYIVSLSKRDPAKIF